MPELTPDGTGGLVNLEGGVLAVADGVEPGVEAFLSTAAVESAMDAGDGGLAGELASGLFENFSYEAR